MQLYSDKPIRPPNSKKLHSNVAAAVLGGLAIFQCSRAEASLLKTDPLDITAIVHPPSQPKTQPSTKPSVVAQTEASGDVRQVETVPENVRKPLPLETRAKFWAYAIVLAVIVIGALARGFFSIKGAWQARKKQKDIKEQSKALRLSADAPCSVEFKIRPALQPTLAVTLASGQVIIGQRGSMLLQHGSIERNLVSGGDLGFSREIGSGIRRVISGEGFFFLHYRNPTPYPARLVLSPSRVGELINVDLKDFPTGLCAAKGAFFAATPGVKLSIIKKGGVKGMFSGMGMFQQKFDGEGSLFLFSAGSLETVEIPEGETYHTDSDALFAWENSVTVEMEWVGFTQAVSSGEGAYVCKISGPGQVWIASRGSADDSSSDKGGGGLFGSLGEFFRSFKS